MLIRTRLPCQHPLCVRGTETARQAPAYIHHLVDTDVLAAWDAIIAAVDLRDPRKRRCKACHRPVALRHLQLIELCRDLNEVHTWKLDTQTSQRRARNPRRAHQTRRDGAPA